MASGEMTSYGYGAVVLCPGDNISAFMLYSVPITLQVGPVADLQGRNLSIVTAKLGDER